MSFEQLIDKVRQAEQALEAQERLAAADWRQLKASWRAGWTPGRIVLAGFVGGFAIGRAQPLRAATGSGALQLLSTLAGLFAGGSAQAAAGQAEQAADSAQETAAAVDPAMATPDAAVDA